MKHPVNVPHALRRTALLLPVVVIMAACLEQPGIVRCDEQAGCPTGYDCIGEACVNLSACGDGIREADETCDDGNNSSGDGCSADCTSDETCGNGVLDKARGENCDDGNSDSGDGCSADCISNETCGNGLIEEALGEICDDGNNKNRDGCPATCKYDCDHESLDYRVCYDLVSWQEARQACQRYDSDLVIIENSSENVRVSERFSEQHWIGLRYVAQEDAFRWVDDSRPFIPLWAPGEPDEIGSLDEVCVEAGVTMGHQWNDLPCDKLRPFICESSACPDCRCGNGLLERGEECDDGDVSPGDGCNNACRIELVMESEPNEDGSPEPGGSFEGNDFDNVNADGPYDATTYIAATLEPAGDEDVFMVTNRGTAMVRVRFDTHDAALGQGTPCFGIDTVLFIRDEQSNILADNDDFQGLCSTVELDIEPGATVYAHVLAFFDLSSIPAPGYLLTIAFQ